MSAFDFAVFWRRLCGIDDQAIALERVRRADAEIEHEEHERLNAPARIMRERAASREPTVSLGTSLRSDGHPYRVQLPVGALRGGGHWMVTGSTGSGKSYFLITVLMQLFGFWASGISPGGIIIFDLKGELAQLLRDVIIPSLVASWNDQLATRLLQRLAVIAPFDEHATPPFQILAREPRLPIEVQAHEVATSFGRTIGNDLGIMQQYVLRMLLVLAIDLGLTLPDVVEMLRTPAFLRWATEHTTLPQVRAYFEERFARERSASVAGLLNRLDSLVMFPALRKMLNAPGMIRFDRLIENSITIVDLGGAPAGIAEVSPFFGQLMFSKVTRAIFTRRIAPGTPDVTIIADEFQQLLTPDMARDFERVLTLIRSQRVFLWSAFQQAAQVESVSPLLLRILRTNTDYKVLFRTELDDARHFAHMLPVTGAVRRERPGFADPRSPTAPLTADEERRQLLEQVPSLPNRVCWFSERQAPYSAILTRSLSLNIAVARRAASTLPAEMRQVIRNGILAVPPEELAATDARREAERQAWLRVPARPPREALSETPNRVSAMEQEDETPGETEEVSSRAARRRGRRLRRTPLG